MKKTVLAGFLLTAFFCTNTFSGITVINKGIPFTSLPSEIKAEVESHYEPYRVCRRLFYLS